MVTYPPLSHDDAQPQRTPGISYLLKGVAHGRLIAGRSITIAAVGLSPKVEAALTGCLSSTIFIGLIVVELHAHVVVIVTFYISRYYEITVHTEIRIAGICLHHKVSLQVIAACCSHGIDECLVVTVLYCEVLCAWRIPVVRNMYLIGTGKCQLIVIVLEGIGYLCPQQTEAGIVLPLILIGRTALQPLVVVNIDNHLHA